MRGIITVISFSLLLWLGFACHYNRGYITTYLSHAEIG